ncbi:MAG: hypothetical protein ABR555_18935, partial [Pyrinomonadaceae bacterium]
MNDANVEFAEDLVALRGTHIILFRRTPGGQWRVDGDSCNAVVELLARIGYEIENRWNIESKLHSYLLDLEFFYPGSIPSVWCGLVEALNCNEEPLPGEELSTLGEPSYERYELRRRRRVLHENRVSIREIEIICEERGL